MEKWAVLAAVLEVVPEQYRVSDHLQDDLEYLGNSKRSEKWQGRLEKSSYSIILQKSNPWTVRQFLS